METIDVGGAFTTTEMITNMGEDVVITITHLPGMKPVISQIAVPKETWQIDPDGARAAIEDYISDKVAIQLSLN